MTPDPFAGITLDMSKVTPADVAAAFPAPTPEQQQALNQALATIHTVVQHNIDATARLAQVLAIVSSSVQIFGRMLTLT